MKSVRIFAVILLMAFLAVVTGLAHAGEETEKGIMRNKSGDIKKQESFAARLADVPELRPGYSPRSEDALRDTEIIKILEVFEKKIRDQKVLSRVKLKLDTVDESRLHMIASLSERIDREAGIGDTIAFFLLTAMVIFS